MGLRHDGTHLNVEQLGMVPNVDTAAQGASNKLIFDALMADIVTQSTTVYFPAGTWRIDIETTGFVFDQAAQTGTTIRGEGDNTVIDYRTTTAGLVLFSFQVDHCAIRDLQIDGTTTSTAAGTGTAANTINIQFQDCNYGLCDRVLTVGGGVGCELQNTGSDYTVNVGHTVRHSRFTNTGGAGVRSLRASQALIAGNICDTGGTGGDGFKFGTGCKQMRVANNLARAYGRDGFDFFDGFAYSVFHGNVAEGNTILGFDVKGTVSTGFDDFAVMQSAFVGNSAQGNGDSGWNLQDVRRCTFGNNVATSNALDGFQINTIQQCTFNGNLASRNRQHGWDAVNLTRCSFSGDAACDNSWSTTSSGGSSQNGTYHGWNLSTANANTFHGIISGNGTASSRVGGQNFGINIVSSRFQRNVISGGSFHGNVSTHIGKESTVSTGYVQRNAFQGHYSDIGVYHGHKMTADNWSTGGLST